MAGAAYAETLMIALSRRSSDRPINVDRMATDDNENYSCSNYGQGNSGSSPPSKEWRQVPVRLMP